MFVKVDFGLNWISKEHISEKWPKNQVNVFAFYACTYFRLLLLSQCNREAIVQLVILIQPFTYITIRSIALETFVVEKSGSS